MIYGVFCMLSKIKVLLFALLSFLLIGFSPIAAKAESLKGKPASTWDTKASVVLVGDRDHRKHDRGRWNRDWRRDNRWDRGDWRRGDRWRGRDRYYYGRRNYAPSYNYYYGYPSYNYGYSPYGYSPYGSYYPYGGGSNGYGFFGGLLRLW